jgi:hypothetical protein
MKRSDFEHTSKPTLIDMLRVMLPMAMKVLKLDFLPRIHLMKNVEDETQPTFGQYVQGEYFIHLAINNRHPNDVLRSLAHELTHFKQDINDELVPTSGSTGSPSENEAHATAGIIMREVNKAHPEFLLVDPIDLP